jgi:hypothetical protein
MSKSLHFSQLQMLSLVPLYSFYPQQIIWLVGKPQGKILS